MMSTNYDTPPMPVKYILWGGFVIALLPWLVDTVKLIVALYKVAAGIYNWGGLL